MFNHDYFAATYFAPSYFPPVPTGPYIPPELMPGGSRRKREVVHSDVVDLDDSVLMMTLL